MVLTALLVSTTLFAQAPDEGLRTRANGLEVVSFQRPEGRVLVYLPEDLAPGDSISGTVATLPLGQGEELEKNSAVLNGLVVSLGGNAGQAEGDSRRWVLAGDGDDVVTVGLQLPGGGEIGTCDVPLAIGADGEGGPVAVDPIIEAGKPVQVFGKFDGNTANTAIRFEGEGIGIPVAESPRSMVFATTEFKTGIFKFSVVENGVFTDCETNSIQIVLEADKTDLIKGESTRLEVKISGLEGLGPDDYPIPVELVNLTSNIVRIEGEKGGIWNNEVRYTQVTAGGNTTIRLDLNSLADGRFTIRGRLYGVSLHDAKKVMTPRMFNDWVRGMCAAYEAKIKELEKELAADRAAGNANPGLEQNIQRRQKNLEILRAFRTTDNNDLHAARIAVDRALAEDNFFSVAADLIDLAAEMLGYSDLPVPGIGAVLKGAKAIASKYPKVLAAIRNAQTLVDAYNQVQGAQAQRDQVAKIKAALEEVKKAIANEQ